MKLPNRGKDVNLAIDGTAYALTVLAPVRPGHERALREALSTLGSHGASPFERSSSTHFARWVVIDRLSYEGPPGGDPPVRLQYVLLASVFNGDLDRYLAELAHETRPMLDAVWGHCLGAPRPVGDDLRSLGTWVRRNQIHTSAFFAPYANSTVRDVRRSLALLEQVQRFAVRIQYATPNRLLNEFREEFVDPRTGELR